MYCTARLTPHLELPSVARRACSAGMVLVTFIVESAVNDRPRFDLKESRDRYQPTRPDR